MLSKIRVLAVLSMVLLPCMAHAWTYRETTETRHTASLHSPAVTLSVVCRIDPAGLANGINGIIELELSARSGPAKREGDLRVTLVRNEEREFRATLHNIGADYDAMRYFARITSPDEIRELRAVLRFDDVNIRLDDGSTLTFPPPRPASVNQPYQSPIFALAPCSGATRRATLAARSITDPRTLQTMYGVANDNCRGAIGESFEQDDACDERAVYSDRLRGLGWCFGRENQIAAYWRWERCRPATPAASTRR